MSKPSESKRSSNRNLMKIFINNLKKNTTALIDLKRTLDKDESNKENYDRIIKITESVNEKLEIIYKLRNDVKMFKTINTILTNHYIKKTKDHESNVDEKIINIESKIHDTYEKLTMEFINVYACRNILTENNVILKNISNDLNKNNYKNNLDVNNSNEIHVRNEIYNYIINKIDRLFSNVVS